MVDITEISAMVAAAGVLVGVVYYILDLRQQTRIRRTDLVTKLASTFNTKEYAEASFRVLLFEYKDHKDFVKKYGSIPSLNPDVMACRMVCVFYEQVGMLLRKKLVEPDLVFDLFRVRDAWERVKILVQGLREQTNDPTLFEWFEYLASEEKKYYSTRAITRPISNTRRS